MKFLANGILFAQGEAGMLRNPQVLDLFGQRAIQIVRVLVDVDTQEVVRPNGGILLDTSNCTPAQLTTLFAALGYA